jgi:hypothetical protein
MKRSFNILANGKFVNSETGAEISCSTVQILISNNEIQLINVIIPSEK